LPKNAVDKKERDGLLANIIAVLLVTVFMGSQADRLELLSSFEGGLTFAATWREAEFNG
jgi:hypothetical protein